ncbi:hypothetical protein JNUCC64_18425 [Streptomyces sp. JNUCC 64]
MPATDRQPTTVPPDALLRTQRALAAALWHYTTAQIAKPYYVRGCVPDPKEPEPRVIVALWTGPTARDKTNVFFSVPLVSDGVLLSAAQIVTGLMRLGKGTHIFGSTGHRFDGKRVLNGDSLVEGVTAVTSPAESHEPQVPQGPRGFYFERPGQLREY